MTKRTWGILATMVGSAVGAWLLTTQRRSRNATMTLQRDRGTVIFDNTPRPTGIDSVI